MALRQEIVCFDTSIGIIENINKQEVQKDIQLSITDSCNCNVCNVWEKNMPQISRWQMGQRML